MSRTLTAVRYAAVPEHAISRPITSLGLAAFVKTHGPACILSSRRLNLERWLYCSRDEVYAESEREERTRIRTPSL